MKKITFIILAGLASLFAGSCVKVESPVSTNDPVVITVEIDQEDGTKATLAESGGFAFSSGDAIKVYQGSTVFTGTTDSNSNSGAFTMSDGFVLNANGLVGFPADIVTEINATDITFTLPASYTFSEVGSANPNTCKAPVPMVGKYTAPGDGKNPTVTLKQAGAVVRFRLNVGEIGEGNISFAFGEGNNVTGEATLESVTPGTSSLTAPSTSATRTITVSISSEEYNALWDSGSEYAYITLPVPAGTVINDSDKTVLVDYTHAAKHKMGTISSAGGTTLARANGFRSAVALGTTPECVFRVGASTWVVIAPGNLMAKISDSYNGEKIATVSEWKFGGYFEIVGDGTTNGNYLFANMSPSAAGKWVDLFGWQGASLSTSDPDNRAHGLIIQDQYADGESTSGAPAGKYYGNVNNESLYSGCWDGLTISNGGEHSWRPMSKDEWQYLIASRTGTTVNGESGKLYSRATVAGVNGLLLLPDGLVWNNSTSTDSRMNTISTPNDLNGSGEYTWGSCTYTALQMSVLAQNGVVFLPVAGYRNLQAGTIIGADSRGDYWTGTASEGRESGSSKYYTAYRLAFRDDIFALEGISRRNYGFSVRLVRDVDNPNP